MTEIPSWATDWAKQYPHGGGHQAGDWVEAQAPNGGMRLVACVVAASPRVLVLDRPWHPGSPEVAVALACHSRAATPDEIAQACLSGVVP